MACRDRPTHALRARSCSLLLASALFGALVGAPSFAQERPAASAVRPGLDRLQAEGFARLRGRRVALVTNHSGIDRRGRHVLDLLCAAEGVSVVAGVLLYD